MDYERQLVQAFYLDLKEGCDAQAIEAALILPESKRAFKEALERFNKEKADAPRTSP